MNKIKELIHNSKFWKAYFISIAVFLCLLLVGAVVFTFWLSDYEKSQNTVEVDKIVELFENGQYSEILDSTDVVKTGFVAKEEYEPLLKEAVSGKTITYTKAFSYDRFAKPAYNIKADGDTICKVVLKASNKKSTFGFALYEFDYISDFDFADIKVVFLTPEGTQPYIDGKTVDEIFAQKLAKDQPSDSEYMLDEAVEIKRYEICGLTKAPQTVEIKNSKGESIEIESNSNNELEAKLYDIKINAPVGYTIKVNNTVLSDKYKTTTQQNDSYAQYMVNESDKKLLDDIQTYRVDSLAEIPEVVVTDKSGNNIDCVYNADTQTFDVGCKLYNFEIPSNYKVKVNGVDIIASPNFLVEKDVVIEELDNCPEEFYTRPVMNIYKVAVMNGELNIQAQNFKGENVELEFDEESMTYYGDFAVADASADEYYEAAINGAKMYAGFMSNDVSMGTFLYNIVSGTQMHDDMAAYRQFFYTDHNSTKFENVEAYDLKVYDETCFSCAVYFDYWIYGQRGDPDFEVKLETNLRLWFVVKNGQWKMVDYEIFDKV